MGLWNGIRHNLSLKLVSLVAAVLLYIYVQQERNPTTTRQLLADVVYVNVPQGYEIVPEMNRVTVTVSGSRISLDRLKDGDIKANADISQLHGNQPPAPVRLTYHLPKSVSDVNMDAATDFVKVQIFKEKTRKIEVAAFYKKEPSPGFDYSQPIVRPSTVLIRGREDRVNRVDRVIVSASPSEPRASIDGDFTPVPWDSDNNVVDSISIEPMTVHVSVTQVPQPARKAVFVSVSIVDQPAPPYRITNPITTPNQVVISGDEARIRSISQIETEVLTVRDFTEPKRLDLALIVPPDIHCYDPQGKPIKTVSVYIPVTRAPATPHVSPGPDQKHDASGNSAKHDPPLPNQ